ALLEKNKADARIAELDQEVATLEKALNANHTDIARLQAKLSEACTRRSNIRARLESAESSIRLRELLNGGAVQDAFSRFDALERKVDEAEGHADAAAIGSDDDEYVAQNRKLNAKVDAELAAMKKSSAG
ncbi:MAG: PspA/IM30 family protein, partial [Parasphingopyxis sp.]